MNNTSKIEREKIELAVSATDATWVAEIVHHDARWNAASIWGKAPLDAIRFFLLQPDAFNWLGGALATGRIRTRKVRPGWGRLNCGRLTAFPMQETSALLLVATHESTLDPLDRALFRSLGRHLEKSGESGGSLNEKPQNEIARNANLVPGLDITELDFESVLKRSVERAREIVGGTGAELGLVDQRNEAVRVLWSDVPGREEEQYFVPLGEDVTGKIAETGMPVVVNHYPGWPDRRRAPVLYESVVGVPLRYKGAVIGTLTVVDDTPGRRFTEEDTNLLEVLATQVAISIRNARLFQELGDRIKAQKAAEGRMVEAARLAAIGEMAASVAHELNNPLTVICGFSELLLDEFPEESRQRENMSLVLSEARRAREVVRRLLDFSRREKSMMAPVNLNEAISQVLALVQPMALTQGVEIRFEAWEDLPSIYGERSQIRQVLLNLVTNGIQAMQQGGNLHIQTTLENGAEARVALRVIDEGVGIPDEYINQVFDPFFTTKPIGSGTGLGLSISKKIIMDHGGEIQVESREREGTCFTVLLPVLDKAREGIV